MLRARELLLILVLAILWSFTVLIIRIGVGESSPLMLTQHRLFFAALFLLLLAVCSRTSLRFERKYWGALTLSTILLNTLPFTLCAYGEVLIDSSTTGIIEGTVPLFTLLTGWLLFKQTRIDLFQLFSFLLALIGLFVVFIPSILAGGIHEDAKGIAYLIGMSLSFAIGFNFSKSYLNTPHPIAVTTIQMLIAPFALLPITIFSEGLVLPTWKVAGLLSLLGITSSMTWVVYFYVIKKTSATIASTASIIAPLFAIIWGYLFLSEAITIYKIVGAFLVVLSLCLLTKPVHNFFAKFVRTTHR